jgi:hypothetical protein
MMMSRYHSKISQKATYLRVYEDNRMLYGEEVTGIIHNLEERIVELEKVLFATPNTHSDEWSDYVCTFCSASDSSHEDDCVYLLATNLRNKALKENP